MSKKEELQKKIEELNIMDDSLFQKMAEDKEFCEEMISTILTQKIKVIRVTSQNSVKNLQGRSVILDALCILEDGRTCNVEVQKANDDNHEKRVRYNTSCITANIMDPGTKFENVPEVIGIFISKFDMFKAGKSIYHIDRTVRETGNISDNGLQEIYVNTKVDDGTDIGKLMCIFKENDTYDFERFPKTSTRKKHFLKEEGGREELSDILKWYAGEMIKEESIEIARKFFEKGTEYAIVRACVDKLSDEELSEIYMEVIQKKEKENVIPV